MRKVLYRLVEPGYSLPQERQLFGGTEAADQEAVPELFEVQAVTAIWDFVFRSRLLYRLL